MKSLSVFCASSDGNKAIFKEEAFQLGARLAKENIQVVYGGGSLGSMGAVARGAISAGGKVIGVMPHFLNRKEVALEGVTEMIYVESMHERKHTMNELSDGSITIPGGFGTLEEFFEMITWGQLGLHEKPTAIYNYKGFYNNLLAHLKSMVDFGLIKVEHMEMLIAEERIDNLLSNMRNFIPPALPHWLKKDQS